MVEPPGQKSAFLWRLDTVSLGKHQRNGVERQQKLQSTAQRNGAHAESTMTRPPCLARSRVRRFPGQKSPLPAADSTPFLCSCAKKRGGAPKKRAYGCRHGSCWVPPASPTDSKPQHNRRLRQADFARPIYPPGISQLDAPIRPVGAYAQMGEAGGPTKVTWRLQSAFLWRLDTVSLGKHQRNGVERQGKVTKTSQRNGAHVQGEEKRGNPRRGFPLGPPPALQ